MLPKPPGLKQPWTATSLDRPLPQVQRTLVVLIFSGVLERFPDLKLASAENEVGWLPFFLQKLDQAQEEYRYLYPAPLKLKPTEYFRRQAYATFIDDAVGVANREFIGAENIMWSLDYPHTVLPWPRSREASSATSRRPGGRKALIVRENVARLYGLPLKERRSTWVCITLCLTLEGRDRG